MVHIIPMSVARRRKDSANGGQQPAGSQMGGSVQPLDEYWQAVADRYQQMMAQQKAFDTEIATRALDGELAKAEADAVANASADGAGLHEGMYGQVDPHTGRVLQTGRFDTLFDNFVKQAPAQIRPDLASRKPALREAGALRMAQQQLDRRRQYEQDHLAGVQAAGLNTIKRSDPNDQPAFDAARRTGLDLISKMDLDPQARLRAEASWRESTAKTRMETLIARDPKGVLEMLDTAAGRRGASTNEEGQPLPNTIAREVVSHAVAMQSSSDHQGHGVQRIFSEIKDQKLKSELIKQLIITSAIMVAAGR